MSFLKNRKATLFTRGEATHDLIVVASIVLILGVLWVLSGGPERASEREGVLGFQQFVQGPSSGFGGLFPRIERTDSASDPAGIEETFGTIRDFGETSPHWGDVIIRKSAFEARLASPDTEMLTLTVSRSLPEPLTISGWTLQSMITNRTVTIPEATKVSTSGQVNIEQPIEVIPGDTVYITTGHSPVGHSFLVNKCSGYFEQFQDFNPSLQKQCPLPTDELRFAKSDTLQFGDACLSFIEDMRRCEMPLQALPQEFPDACHVFINREINYNSCVLSHRNDDDFFTLEWRVYLKRSEELWGTRDIVRLLDENGKTVDVFSYK